MENIFDIFETRGFIEQVTDGELVRELLKEPTTCYIGFDPTAKSLHVGSLLPIMSLVHLQRAGHRPLVVVGGSTAMVGDPSGKSEMRPIMTRDEIGKNADGLKSQLSRFIDFSEGKAIMLNNAEWLADLFYIDFLRDIGRHFSVNRMLAAESYRARLETGLNFIEFNYMLLQAYDFWYLFKNYECRLQIGGNDQWGNILAGVDLTRRLDRAVVYGLTIPLLTTSSGIKMGKTHKGAVWLDRELTSTHDYYQYWINQDDRDIERFLGFFTLLPMDEVHRLGSLQGSEIREAKEILAYEATKLCHGREAADLAKKSAEHLFKPNLKDGMPNYDSGNMALDAVPSFPMSSKELGHGIPAYILFHSSGLCKTRGDARRLISQGGGYLNDQRINSFDQIINMECFNNGLLLIRAGKKKYMKICVK